MEFSRKNATTLSLKVLDSTFTIEVDEMGYIKVLNQEGKGIIEKPGEYEFKSVSFIALEEVKEDAMYTARPNLLNVNSTTYGAIFAFSPVELNKELISTISHSHMLVTSNIDPKFVKGIQRSVPVEKIILLPQFVVTNNSLDLVEIKKQLDVPEIIEEKKLKFTDKDFNAEEDKIAEVYVLS